MMLVSRKVSGVTHLLEAEAASRPRIADALFDFGLTLQGVVLFHPISQLFAKKGIQGRGALPGQKPFFLNRFFICAEDFILPGKNWVCTKTTCPLADFRKSTNPGS